MLTESRTPRSPETSHWPNYRFGFILTTCLGNSTRYNNLRKYAERDPEVECVWAPINYQVPEEQAALLKKLPSPLYWQSVSLYQASTVLKQLHRLDAVMVHQFEPSMVLSLRRLAAQYPVIVSSTDDTPLINPEGHPMYPNELRRSPFLQKLRLWMDLWRARQADMSLPMSYWAGNILTQDCGVANNTVHSIPVGLDLEDWPAVPPRSPKTTANPKILFVGNDFQRKGGDLLLQVHQQHFADQVELHLVTKEPVAAHLPNVFVYNNITVKDDRLRRLYAEADLFVLPTTCDLVPWVCLEAMASSCPVISTKVGGIPDLIRPGENGWLIEPGDAQALVQSIQHLLDNPAQRQRMGQRGREIVEQEFSAAVNVPRMLNLMKQRVNFQRTKLAN